MKSITITIINDKAIGLLRELELLNLIQLKRDEPEKTNWARYKGAMCKQKSEEIEQALEQMRSEWN